MHRDPHLEAHPGDTHNVGVPLETTANLPLISEGEGLSRSVSDVSVALPHGVAMLVVAHGPNAGARFLLDRDVTTAGRHPDSDIFLDDITVSRQHAQFRRESGEFAIVDQGSLNGVYVNSQRVHTTPLRDGDDVQIGKFRLTFHAN
jgi:pSer/pThr/pTyr-binding forkhead associated (FHA) protein